MYWLLTFGVSQTVTAQNSNLDLNWIQDET